MIFRQREFEHLTQVEKAHLIALPKRGSCKRFFLYHPPFFYANPEDCGKEVYEGHVSKWTTFIIVETLLASLAVQPLVANVSLQGWKLTVYGGLWMLTLLSSFIGLFVNAVFLGYLLHCPHKLVWIWLCKLGYVSEAPRVLLWISGGIGAVAIGYTAWSLYGTIVGILGAVLVLGGVCFTKWLLIWLKLKLEETYEIR